MKLRFPTYAVPLVIVAVCYGMMFSIMNSGYTMFIELDSSSRQIGQIFWTSSAGFSESKSVRHNISKGQNQLWFGFRDKLNVRSIRFDPGRSEGRVELRKVVLSNDKCLLPWFTLCISKLERLPPVWINHVELRSDKHLEVEMQGNDPGIAWTLPKRNYFLLSVVLINSAGLVAVFLLVATALRRLMQLNLVGLRLKIWKASLSLALYPIYLGSSNLTSRYFEYTTFDKSVLFLSICIFFLGIVLQRDNTKKVSWSPIRLNLLVLWVATISPDVAFHMGKLDAWRFGNEPGEYHWRINRTLGDNLNRSSLFYQDDIELIGGKVGDFKRFLSDRATSLYIVASAGLYSLNPMEHHRVRASYLTDSERTELCSPRVRWPRVDEILKRLNAHLIIVNRHRGNPYVAQSCLTRTLERLVDRFPDKFVLRMEGRHLSLYEIVG